MLELFCIAFPNEQRPFQILSLWSEKLDENMFADWKPDDIRSKKFSYLFSVQSTEPGRLMKFLYMNFDSPVKGKHW